MRRFVTLLTCFVFVAIAHSPVAASEKRLALVIGNGSYTIRALPITVNDAALVAQTLQASGFEVTSLRDLNEANLRQSFRDFLIKVRSAGADTVVAVYFAGLGLQCEGENFLLPVDANVSQPSDVFRHALPLSEQMHSLAALDVKASFLILDAARSSPFLLSDRPPAGGFAWREPEANMLLAFNATPGTVARDGTDGYDPYAVALAEMIRSGGLGTEDLFDNVRLRVAELTGGAQVPWDASNMQTRFKFSEPGATKKVDDRAVWMRSQPMRKLGPDDAFWVALLRDTFDGYAEFLAEYGNDPMAKRVEVLLAARRESITWRRSNQANVPDAYWTYLELYPHGPHVADAEQLLTQLGATTTPPAKFRRLDYDVPPPLPAELELTDQPVLRLDDPAFASAPLKPLPDYFLQAPPPELRALILKTAPSVKNALLKPPSLQSAISVMPRPQMPGPPDQLGLTAAGPTSGKATNNGPGPTEGQGGSLFSGAAGPTIKPASNAQSSVLTSMPVTNNPGSPVYPKASPGPSVPAWASLLPKDNNALDTATPVISNGIMVPLFVSAALAVEPAGHTALANVRSGPRGGSPQSPLSGRATRVPITGGIARPPSALAPADGRARTAPSQQRALTTSAVAPVTTQGNRLQGRTSRIQGELGQNLPLPGARPSSVVTPLPGNGPKPGAGAAPTPKAADQAAQLTVRKPSTTPKPSPGPSSPDETSAAAPRSQKNPCTVSDGRLDCGESR